MTMAVFCESVIVFVSLLTFVIQVGESTLKYPAPVTYGAMAMPSVMPATELSTIVLPTAVEPTVVGVSGAVIHGGNVVAIGTWTHALATLFAPIARLTDVSANVVPRCRKMA